MKNVRILKAIYTDFYGEKTEEILGIFDNETKLNKAIQAYIDKKYRYNAEGLLDNTEFKTQDFELNKINH